MKQNELQKQIPAAKTGSAYTATDFAADVTKAHVKAGSGNTVGKTEKKSDLKTTNRESESIYESAKKVAQFVAIDAPAVAKATGEAIAESGADNIRRQKIEELSQRKHPQDRVKGQMFEVEKIYKISGDFDKAKIYTDKHTEVVAVPAGGTIKLGGKEQDFGPPIPKGVDHPMQYRYANSTELAERLKELNGGAPLTDFENKLVSQFGEDPRISHNVGSVTPIKGLDAKGEKIDKEVQGYKVKTIEAGLNTYTYYDRNGNVLKGSVSIPEAPLIDRNLGPFDYVGFAQLGKQVLGKAGARIGERFFVKKEAEAVLKAETGAAARSAEQQAATQQGQATEAAKSVGSASKAEAGAGARSVDPQASTQLPQTGDVAKAEARAGARPADPAPAASPQGETLDTGASVRSDIGKGVKNRPAETAPDGVAGKATPGSAKVPPKNSPHETIPDGLAGRTGANDPKFVAYGNGPRPDANIKFRVKTVKGSEEMKFSEYSRRYRAAKEWVQNNKPKSWPPDLEQMLEVQKKAAEKFGLQKTWYFDANDPMHWTMK